MDYYAHPNEVLRRLTRESIAAMMGEGNLDRTDPDDIGISGGTLGRMCEGERFAGQITAAGCSATLIDDDLVLTAGHCIDAGSCAGRFYVFNY